MISIPYLKVNFTAIFYSNLKISYKISLMFTIE